jgi:hypothetical protein
MNSNDVKEWMIIADADFESAKILPLPAKPGRAGGS